MCYFAPQFDFDQMTLLIAGEGSEEIGNMIENYIKEIEELRYFNTNSILRKNILIKLLASF